MKSIKIKVFSKEHSKAIQKRLFELGYYWSRSQHGCKPSYTDKKYLYGQKSGLLSYGDLDSTFRSSNHEVVTINDLYEMEKEVTELSVAEIAKRLGLQPDQLKIIDNS